MSTTSLFPVLVNQKSTFIETSTDFDNSTYQNYSGDEDELQRYGVSTILRWSKNGTFRLTFWYIFMVIVVFGIIGNILVFIMMCDKKLRPLSYSVYLKFMAVSDSWLLIVRLVDEFQKTFQIGYQGELNICLISFVIRVLVMVLSPWLVAGVALDRYICVSFPLTRGRLCTTKKAIVICLTMLALSFASCVPIPFNVLVIRGRCFPTEGVRLYYILVRLLFSSIMPCFIILALNILIIVQIKRSHNFRNAFLRSNSDSTTQQDSATRPLVLVSVLAFVTLVPVSLSESVMIILKLLEAHQTAQDIISNIWFICFVIYLFNFGQNFYILMGSSSTYREIIRKKLICFSLKWKGGTQLTRSALSSMHATSSGSRSGSGATGSTQESATSGETKTVTDAASSAVTNSTIWV